MTPSSPDDFREEIEQDVANGQEFVEEAAQEAAPPELAEMESMAEAAETDIGEEPPTQEAPEVATEDTQDTAFAEPAQQDMAPPELGAMESMAETAVVDVGEVDSAGPPPEVAAMGDMEATAKQDLPRDRTQAEQVAGTGRIRDRDLFEFDVGSFEADQGGIEWTQAESSYREVNYHWQSVMTAMVIDHQHRLEQLLAMLERER